MDTDVAILLVLVAVVVVLAGVLWRRHPNPVSVILFGVVVVLAAAWVANLVFVATDYRDADGFTDCWPDCTAFQTTVQAVFWGGGLLLALAGVGAAIALVVGLVRSAAGDDARR